VLFCRYANHTLVSRCTRYNHGVECESLPTIHTLSIFGEPILLVRMDRTTFCHDIIHSYCIKKRTLKTKKNLKFDSNSKSYLENPINFNPSWFLRLVSKFYVSTLFRKLMEFPTTPIFRVTTDLASIKLKFQSWQITSFGSNQNFQQPPTAFRDHNSWIVSPIVAPK
jgi:hypothetical protein